MSQQTVKKSATESREARPTLAADYLSPKAVCERLHCCQASFYRLLATGKLTYIKLGNKTLISEHALAEYLASCERTGAPSKLQGAFQC